jgi:branched-chain amino acid transport system ATP-binding protein
MADTLLEVNDLGCSYGHIRALDGIDLNVEKGRIVCLIGNNGAGKSTVLNAVCGVVPLYARRKGSVRFLGERIDQSRSERIVRMGMSQVPEGRRIFAELSVEDNLLMGAFLRRNQEQVRHDLNLIYNTFPILFERRRQPGGHLSGGEQQMLAIGRGLMARPKLLLLDEPSLGLAPLMVQEIFRIIKDIHENGTTILLVEQNARMALETADYGYVLEKGRIVLQGTGRVLLGDSGVKKIYLGEA